MPESNICCVKCNSVLDKAVFQGLEVDLCPRCGGLWLDRGEIVKASRLPAEDINKLRSLLADSGGPPPIPTSSIVPCPSCPGRLAEVSLGTVHVEYCSDCFGIFLDRGELEQAIEYVRQRDGKATGQQVVAAAASVTPGQKK